MPEPDDRDSLDILKAPLRRLPELKELQFRLAGFAVGLALLVTLAPTWLTRDYGDGQLIYSGIGMIHFTDHSPKSPMGGLGTFLFLLYLVLALAALLPPTETIFALVRGGAGLVVTILILVSKPDHPTLGWTGAPVVALGLWLLAVVVAGVARTTTRG
ncbi:hypothetical protein E0H75_34130 [Kribbella capetownensis]|uniref:Uncharacterized protein n=1 Tax=Kribbella capetownensis TaxID=1572659 RepID=A0A4R0JG55_9ACTN|nr:hypothetical protein [Kribbella capetownensis]TCC44604.1 hypothetical protein E0H75_34130 [Kribbella capetownensis]